VGFRLIEPRVNPRSEFYWFRRRVPAAYRNFGMRAEIKFSLGTKDWDEAVLRCNEHNLRLEREWRANLVSTTPDELSHRQIVALAGEFYEETVAAHRDEPGSPNVWDEKQRALAKLKARGFLRIAADAVLATRGKLAARRVALPAGI
jgi:hypothetical protein